MSFGVHWNDADRSITFSSGDVAFALTDHAAWHLVIMAARMLRGNDVPYPYTFEETERIALSTIRQHIDDADEIAADAGPMLSEDDRDAIRHSLDDASGKVMELSQLINRLRSETGIDR